MTGEVTPATRFSTDLKTWVTMIGTIAVGVAWTAISYARMTFAYERLEKAEATRATLMLTKADLLEERKETAKTIRQVMGMVRTKCPPYVIRGQKYVICEIVDEEGRQYR